MKMRRNKNHLLQRCRQSSIVKLAEAIIYEQVLRHIEKENGELAERMLAEFVEFCELEDDMLLLDVACGPGRITRALARRVTKAIALDYSPFMLHYVKKNAQQWDISNIESAVGNGFNLPFPDSTFDRVISTNAFPAGQPKPYREMVRVLKPRGKIICSIPFSYNHGKIAKTFYQRNRIRGLQIPIRVILKYWEWKMKRATGSLPMDKVFGQIGLQKIVTADYEDGFMVFAKGTKPGGKLHHRGKWNAG